MKIYFFMSGELLIDTILEKTYENEINDTDKSTSHSLSSNLLAFPNDTNSVLTIVPWADLLFNR